jgi:hypothetical protein
MALSRYQDIQTVKDEFYNEYRVGSFPPIKSEEIKDDINDITIVYNDTMRFDKLAADYLGDGKYWWAICLLNDINLPYSVQNGTVLRIPTSMVNILTVIRNKAGK